MRITATAALEDPNLLGSAFAGDSWEIWKAVLRAAEGLPLLTRSQRADFREVAGGRDPPTSRVKELWCICGRRAGKDSVAAAIATAAAIGDYRKHLRPGERAVVMCLAVSREQSRIVLRYITAYFTQNPLLRPLIVRENEDGLELNNGVDIVVATNSYRSTRGRTLCCAILDEVSFWRDLDSATPDVETYHSLLPGLSTLPGAMLIGITTAYRRSGLAYEKWRAHFGKPGDDVLCVYGPSTAFNPTLPQRIIDTALARDPEAARAEWLSEWRSDLSDFLDRELIEDAVDHGVHVRPPQPSRRYVAFADPSGGRGDSFTCAIAHSEGDTAVLDALYEKAAPFDPTLVVPEVAALLKSYRIAEVTGDKYAAEWVVSAFRQSGIVYKNSERDRSKIYLDVLPLFASGRVRLIDNRRLVHQFAGLERRVSRSGVERVDHGPQGFDDLSNSASGVLVNLSKPPALIFSAEDIARVRNSGRGASPGYRPLRGGSQDAAMAHARTPRHRPYQL